MNFLLFSSISLSRNRSLNLLIPILYKNNFINQNNNLLEKKSFQLKNVIQKSIFTSSWLQVKKINIEENDNEIIVEGIPIESDRKDYLIQFPKSSSELSSMESSDIKTNCACPLCRLDLKRLEYSDVLILNQFIESNGRLMLKEDTGLCSYSYKIIKKCVKQAQSAKLLPRPPEYESYGPWDNLNHYYEYPRRIRDMPKNVIKKQYWK